MIQYFIHMHDSENLEDKDWALNFVKEFLFLITLRAILAIERVVRTAFVFVWSESSLDNSNSCYLTVYLCLSIFRVKKWIERNLLF